MPGIGLELTAAGNRIRAGQIVGFLPNTELLLLMKTPKATVKDEPKAEL
jgi:hypothetical protein